VTYEFDGAGRYCVIGCLPEHRQLRFSHCIPLKKCCDPNVEEFTHCATFWNRDGCSGARSGCTEAVQIGLSTGAGVAGRGILLMLGVWTLVGYFRSRLFTQLSEEESDNNDDRRRSAPGQAALIRTSEAMMAGTALAVDNLAPSFAFGLINPIRQNAILFGLLLGALAAGFSIVAVVCGQISGRKGRAQFQRFLPAFITPALVSGLLLVGIAVLPLDIDDWTADFLKL
jgi:hypothetical protein